MDLLSLQGNGSSMKQPEIVGDQDTADIHAIGELLRKESSGAELVKLPNVAHTLSMEVPDTFNDLVSQFLQRNV